MRRFFARGLAVLLPTLLTLIILLWGYSVLDRYVAGPLNQGIRYLIQPAFDRADLEQRYADRVPPDKRPIDKQDLIEAWWDAHYLGWVGLVVALALVFVVGLMVANFMGRATWRLIEGGLLRAPVIKQIYPYVKQVTDFLLSEGRLEFSRVVLVEYPRKGCWSMGFVTGGGFVQLERATGKAVVSVFVPSSPTPVTGYVVQVPKEDVLEVDLTVDEALRYAITAGVVGPGGVVGGQNRLS